MIDGEVADKISQCEPSLQGELFFFYIFSKITLCIIKGIPRAQYIM